MTNEPILTVVGNLTDAPELRFTPSGAAVANFTVASTPSNFNRQTNAWEDGETLFLRCSIWRQAAENVAESLERGTRVVVTGRLKSRSYETREGEKRTAFELDVEEIGPSLRYATAKVTRTPSQGTQQRPAQQTTQVPDPWAQPASAQPRQSSAPAPAPQQAALPVDTDVPPF